MVIFIAMKEGKIHHGTSGTLKRLAGIVGVTTVGENLPPYLAYLAPLAIFRTVGRRKSFYLELI
jgi:hypothetical protein